MFKLSSSRSVLAFALILGLFGCGKTHPPVAEVKGTVTYHGNPAVGGRVLFLPEQGGKQGLGTIQPDGTFAVGTFSKDDGALIGKHQAMFVRVSLDGGHKDLLTFQRADSQRLVVEPDKVNEFTIDLGNKEWQELAD